MKKILMIIPFFTMLCLFNSKVMAYKEYKIGDIIEYKGVNYYVIKNSNISEETITLLKAEPLTVEEVNTYGGVGTSDNHVNMYTSQSQTNSCYQTAYNKNGYGGIQYYSSATCTPYGDSSGCTNTYANSEIKYVVDAWKAAEAPLATEARLMRYDEFENLGYDWGNTTPSDIGLVKTENTPSWVYNSNYYYWTMSPWKDSASDVWSVGTDGGIYFSSGVNTYCSYVVRPVIVLKKENLLNIEGTNDSNNKQDSKDSEIISLSEYDSKKNTDNHSEIVYVDNTASKKSVLIVLIGFLLAGIGIVAYYIIAKKIERK